MDEISVTGLEVLLDEDSDPPYLELHLRAGSRPFIAAILAVQDQWALNVRDEQGHSLAGDGELYAMQSDAIVAAMLTALHEAATIQPRQQPLNGHKNVPPV